jgi:UDP-N-acetylglucosamine 2-epimerase (non-hydrolysing)
VVVGDVNSSLAAALVAAKKLIPVAHIEAGLRSFDLSMPEELNRIIIDSISTMLFTTEPAADFNLESENHIAHIYRVGNVMIDTLKSKLPEAKKLDTYKRYGLKRGEYVLVTLHRPSNVDSKVKLTAICNVMKKISKKHKVIFLAHPRTQKKIKQFKLSLENIIYEEPVGYLENLNLMDNANVVVTDSGGIQEETTFLGVPCVTLRRSTERPITVVCGTNVVAGVDHRLYEQIILDALSKKRIKDAPQIHLWDGKASERIMRIIQDKFAGDEV